LPRHLKDVMIMRILLRGVIDRMGPCWNGPFF